MSLHEMDPEGNLMLIASLPENLRLPAIERLCAEHKKEMTNELNRVLDTKISLHESTMHKFLEALEEVARFMQNDEFFCFRNYKPITFDHMSTTIAQDLLNHDIMPLQACRSYAKLASERIFHYWDALKEGIEPFEALIRKLWKAKSKAQKKAILLAAWPDINLQHRPDIEHRLKGDFADKAANMRAYAWPHINLEDLLRPNALLIFLNARGRHPPSHFSHSDLELAPFFKVPKAILDLRKDNFIMSFLGKQSAKEYGALGAWEQASAMKEAINTGRFVHMDHGIQILCIQSHTLQFLGRCVYQILKDCPSNPSNALVPQPQPPYLTENDSLYSSMEIVAREAPYRLPTRLDFSRLQALSSARKSQAIDNVVALREDPGYFAEAVEQFRDNRPELILDQDGGSHDHATDFPLYAKVLRHLASDAHCAVFYWNHIHKSIIKVQELHTKYTSSISVEKDLPVELSASLSSLRFFIQMISLDIITNIKTAFAASPALRKYHFRDPNHESGSRTYYVVHNTNVEIESRALHKILAWKYLFETNKLRDAFTLHNLLDEFERLMQVEPHAKEAISPYIADHISQLSIMSVCLHQLHQFQPWAAKIENDKFDYPSDKRRTPDTVKKMIAAEQALDNFWQLANEKFRRYTGTTPIALVEHLIGDRPLQRTSPWVEPSKLDLKSSLESEAFSVHFHDATKQITGSFDKLSVSSKAKTKTRGAAAVENEVPIPTVAKPATSSPSRIKVDKRALKVFRTLFHSPDNPDQPGEVSWKNFLHALVSAGFAAEKLQGSAWHFTPTAADVERSIQFHEPHPSDKLPFTWARRYGRRLTRAFGWSLETFSLA